MHWKTKHKVEPATLAELLVAELVNTILVGAPEDLHLTPEVTARYETKARLYQLAAVLMGLITEEQKNPNFLAVRESFERNIFPSSPVDGSEVLHEVKTAMRDLNELLNGAKAQKEMSWAREWLQDIGIDEVNPVRLALFAMHWMDYSIMVSKTLRDFQPLRIKA